MTDVKKNIIKSGHPAQPACHLLPLCSPVKSNLSLSLSPSSMINTEGEGKKRERKMLQRLERQGSHSRPISLWHMPVTGCLHLSVRRNCSHSLSSLSQQSNTAHRRRARALRSRLWKASVHTIAEEGEGDNLWGAVGKGREDGGRGG